MLPALPNHGGPWWPIWATPRCFLLGSLGGDGAGLGVPWGVEASPSELLWCLQGFGGLFHFQLQCRSMCLAGPGVPGKVIAV